MVKHIYLIQTLFHLGRQKIMKTAVIRQANTIIVTMNATDK